MIRNTNIESYSKDEEVIDVGYRIQDFIWPHINNFLWYGVSNLLDDREIISMKKDIIFIDFSIYLLPIYVNSGWLNEKSIIGKNLVLICDRHMVPLAHSWKEYTERIIAVIFHDDCLTKIKDKIIKGRPDLVEFKRTQIITRREMTILSLLISGESLTSIAIKTDLSVTKIYNIRHYIEIKLGITLRQLLCISLIHFTPNSTSIRLNNENCLN